MSAIADALDDTLRPRRGRAIGLAIALALAAAVVVGVVAVERRSSTPSAPLPSATGDLHESAADTSSPLPHDSAETATASTQPAAAEAPTGTAAASTLPLPASHPREMDASEQTALDTPKPSKPVDLVEARAIFERAKHTCDLGDRRRARAIGMDARGMFKDAGADGATDLAEYDRWEAECRARPYH